MTTPIDANAGVNSVSENAAVGTTVGMTVSAVDSDATISGVTYSLVNNDAGRFAIDANTGVVTVAGAINRETDGAVRNITVRATSQDGSFADQTFAINIVDVDEFDVTTPVDLNAVVNSVAENAAIGTTVGVTGSAVDSDATTNGVSYSLVNNDAGRFAIDVNTGVVTVAGAINREADGAVRNITIRATSQDGSFADQTFAISIVDVDEFNVTVPVDANAGINTVAENSAVGTTVGITGHAVDSDATTNGVIYSLVDNDGGRFAIDTNTGVVSVAGAIDFETDGGLRNITIRATSQDSSFVDQTFAINITPVNDNLPIFQSTAVMTSEENTTGVGQVVATDADLPGQPLVYSLSGADAALFTLDQDTGVLQFNVAHDFERPADSDHDGIYELVITADDQSGGVSTQALQVVAVDVNETSTAITLQQPTLFENTNTLGGFAVGDLIVTDEDSPETFDISVIGGADGAKFRVQGNQLILDDGSLDYERQSSYEVLLRLVDSGGNIYQQHVQVVVQDVNEVPIARADEFFLYNTYLFEVGGPACSQTTRIRRTSSFRRRL